MKQRWLEKPTGLFVGQKNGVKVSFAYLNAMEADETEAFVKEAYEQGVRKFTFWGTAGGLQVNQQYMDRILPREILHANSPETVRMPDQNTFFGRQTHQAGNVWDVFTIFSETVGNLNNAPGMGLQATEMELFFLAKFAKEHPDAKLSIYCVLSEVLSWKGHEASRYNALNKDEKKNLFECRTREVVSEILEDQLGESQDTRLGARLASEIPLWDQPDKLVPSEKNKSPYDEIMSEGTYLKDAKKVIKGLMGSDSTMVSVGTGRRGLPQWHKVHPLVPWENLVAALGAKVVVCEPNAAIAKEWEALASDHQAAHQNTRVIPKTLEDSGIENNSVDAISMMSVLSYSKLSPQQRQNMLSVAARILRDNGLLIVGWYNNEDVRSDEYNETQRFLKSALTDKGFQLTCLAKGSEPHQIGDHEYRFVTHDWACYRVKRPDNSVNASTDAEKSVEKGRAPPKMIEIEVTNQCNLRCLICKHGLDHLIKPPVHHMSFDQFKSIVDAYDYSIEKIQFCGTSEPTLNPALVRMVDYVVQKKHPKVVELITNATLLNAKLSRQLVDAGINSLVASVDGADEATYRAVRRHAFEPVKENLKQFGLIAKGRGVTFQINSTILKLNVDHLMGLPAFASQVGASSLELRIYETNLERLSELAVHDPKTIERVVWEVKEEAKRQGIACYIFDTTKNPQKIECKLAEEAHINYLGFLTLCYHLPSFNIVNLLGIPIFSQAWNDEKLLRHLEQIKRGIFDPICSCLAAILGRQKAQVSVDVPSIARLRQPNEQNSATGARLAKDDNCVISSQAKSGESSDHRDDKDFTDVRLAERHEIISPIDRQIISAKIQTFVQENKLALEHLVLEICFIKLAQELQNPLPMALKDNESTVFKVEIIKDQGVLTRVDLVMEGETEPLMAIHNPRHRLNEIRQSSKKASWRSQETAQGVATILNLSALKSDMAIAKTHSTAVGHLFSLRDFSRITDRRQFVVQLQLLIQQITRAHMLSGNDMFFLEDTESLNQWQRIFLNKIVDESRMISPDSLKAKNNYIHIGSSKVFLGVLVQYVVTDALKDIPKRDARTLLVPVSGFNAKSVLGWYSVIRVGGVLGNVFSKNYDAVEHKINFNLIGISDIPQEVFHFYNSKAVNPVSSRQLLIQILIGDTNVKSLKQFSFSLPLIQGIPIEIIAQGLRLALKTVGAAA